jgi:hypothetical protein
MYVLLGHVVLLIVAFKFGQFWERQGEKNNGTHHSS